MMKNIKKITICGYGLIGGSIALDLLRNSKSYEICAYDRKAVLERLGKNKRHKVIVETNFNKAINDADIIILSAPHKPNEQMLERISKSKQLTDCLIIDTGAVKSPISNLAKSLRFGDGVEFVATHPMAGREKAGFENSAGGLFNNHAWYTAEDFDLCPTNKLRLNWLIKKVGANQVDVSSQLHDELVSEISHLPQLISTILGGQVNPNLIPLAGPGLRSMLRLSGSPYSVWKEIIRENKDEIIKSLSLYRDNLNKVIDKIEEDESLDEMFKDSFRSYKCL